MEDATWIVRYLVVDTRPWLPGGRVLVAPTWVADIRWASRSVVIELPHRKVRSAPRYEPGRPIERGYERRLYDHYERPIYC